MEDIPLVHACEQMPYSNQITCFTSRDESLTLPFDVHVTNALFYVSWRPHLETSST